MLTVLATPIGSLDDMTVRGIKIIHECDIIVCEDTRVTSKLLNHLNCKKKMVSLHKFNERKRTDKIIKFIKSGLHVVLVSDAGTPAISDPGHLLVKECLDKSLKIQACPGCSSVTAAISISGLNAKSFQFKGFIPQKGVAAKKVTQMSENYDGITIFFTSPRRLKRDVSLFSKDTYIVIVREMTKIHEEITRGTQEEVMTSLNNKNIKGEVVILVEGNPQNCHLSIDEQDALEILRATLSRSDAAKIMAKLTSKAKSLFYK